MSRRRALPPSLSMMVVLSLVAFPGASANHDGDPLPDSVEVLVCGFPDVAGVINGLPPAAGRCTMGDYVSPAFNSASCPECSRSTAHSSTNQPLTPSHDVAPVPLPPQPVPSVGPFSTPAVNQPVGTVQGFRSPTDPDNYCVTVTPSGGPTEFVCIDMGDLAPLLPPIPPTTLVQVGSQTLGPTPGVPAGSLGATPPQHVPALSADLVVGYRWVESRLSPRLTTSQLVLWEPVDLDSAAERQWWTDNGQKTSLDLTLTLRSDGVPVQTIQVQVPFVGQAAAAIVKTA